MAVRFPQWQHEQSEWGRLEAISRQMQAEASEIFYSAKNTFFLPAQPGLHYNREDTDYILPINIKRIDCEFNMDNFTMIHREAYKHVKKMLPVNAQQIPFADWSRDEFSQHILTNILAKRL